jgi:serine/threonine protein kinase
VLKSCVGGYSAETYIDRGASALVFKARRDAQVVALKVFDPEFLKAHPKEVETGRIERQLLLKGQHHDNLIDILDGGQCAATGLYYVAMPFLPAPRLDQVVSILSRDRIRPILAQIASAAHFLESQKLVHRDIKPANIVITPDHEKAVLLDLGVVKPLGLHDLTDLTDTLPFVGTTRYSPPEFNFRDEEDSEEGWRAVTFYQLGAILHDMLMRRPLFHDRSSPYQRLVRAILVEEPVINCTDVPDDLVRLAKACLLKEPAKRLALVSWESFAANSRALATISQVKERLRQLKSAVPQPNTRPNSCGLDEKEAELCKQVITLVRQECVRDRESFPPLHVLELQRLSTGSGAALSFAASARHGLSRHLTVFYRIALLGEAQTASVLRIAAVLSNHVVNIEDSRSSQCEITCAVDPKVVSEVAARVTYQVLAAAVEHELLSVVENGDPNNELWLKVGELGT